MPARDRLLGLFLELRAIPVLLWAYTAIVLGTAVATAEAGRFDTRNLLEALLIGVLIQGYETHAVNEIFDWRSGTDRDGSPRVLSGGSRVLTARLLEERHLWAIFAGSSILIWVLALDLAARTGPLVLALVGMGYFAGLLYTLPPIATAYRPFAGEWLGGFVGVTAGGLGAYYVQALRITPLAVAVAVAHACVCVGMLLMHHYLDADADRRARPMKRTTIVFLGARRGKAYTAGFAGAALVLSVLLGLLWRVEAFAFGFAAMAGLVAHVRAEPADVASVTRHELTVIQAGVAGGLMTAALLVPVLAATLPIAVLLYSAHLRASLAVRTAASERYGALVAPPS